MDWSDDGIVLAARRHGESSAVVQLLTREHGRHAGRARRGAASRGRGIYQPGNLVAARWRGSTPPRQPLTARGVVSRLSTINGMALHWGRPTT